MKDSAITKDATLSTYCNICGCDSYEEICDIKISPVLTPSKLVKCKKCSLFYANPRLKREVEEDYYRKLYHEIQGEDWWHEGRTDVFKSSLAQVYKFINKGRPRRIPKGFVWGRLVDVGCGMGFFMDLARISGWEVKGVEISDYAVDYARYKLDLDVIKADLKDAHFESEYFDVATMWAVLDQLHDPRASLVEANRILKKGGYIFICVSNLFFHLKLFMLCNKLKILSEGLKDSSPPSFHLYSFDKNSIKKLLESTGFSNVIVKIEPTSLNFSKVFGEKTRKAEEALRRLFDLVAGVLYFLSLGKIIVSPSIFVIAQKE